MQFLAMRCLKIQDMTVTYQTARRENAGYAISSLQRVLLLSVCVSNQNIYMSLAKYYCSSTYLFTLKAHHNAIIFYK